MKLFNKNFWIELTPSLTIGQERAVVLETSENSADIPRLVKEGYLQFNNIYTYHITELDDISDCISALVKLGLLPIFCFIYDEPWILFHKLSQQLSTILGKDYRQIPAFWAWHIETKDKSAGWLPHRDRSNSLNPDGTPKTLSVWIPLKNALANNGCMHIVPAHADVFDIEMNQNESIPYNDVRELLQRVRALPAPAGTAFCWNQHILHWGGRSSEYAEHPRVSISFEFQRGDLPAYDVPLLDPHVIPKFEDRLKLIAKQISQYGHMYGIPGHLFKKAKMFALAIEGFASK